MMKALRTGSGYYIDVGASDLIASGDIAVRSGIEIRRVKEHSVELTDGSELTADLIVMATGFQSMNRTVAGNRFGRGRGQSGQVLGAWLTASRTTRGPGKASRATCGGPPSSRACGFTGAICIFPGISRSSLRFRSRRAWRAADASVRAAAGHHRADDERSTPLEEEYSGRNTMGIDELAYMSAAEIAERVRRRNLSPVEIVDACIAAHRAPQPDPQRVRVQGLRGRAA